MINLQVQEYDLGVEGKNVLPPPKSVMDILVLFYSNGWIDFTHTVKCLPSKDNEPLRWDESDFKHWKSEITESERIPFRSYIYIGKVIRDSCTNRDKLQSETLYTLRDE
jgi:hypothetical protein